MAGVSQAAFFEDSDARKAILDLRTKLTEQETKISSLEPLVSQKADLLEKQISSLAERLERLEKSQDSLFDLNSDIDSLKRDLAQLHGQVDILAKSVEDIKVLQNEIKKNTDSLSGDVQKNQDTENLIQKSMLLPKSVEVEGVEGFATAKESAEYDKAFILFKNESFGDAEQAFAVFLRSYPSSFYAQFALYWYANSAYALKNYGEAVFRYRTFISNYLANARVPDAMLAMAVSQKELGQPGYEQTVLQLKERFPNSEAAKVVYEYFPDLAETARKSAGKQGSHTSGSDNKKKAATAKHSSK
jgi:TolA-binding protein